MTEGERIKELRYVLSGNGEKMTLEKFGDKLGVGKTAISKIENGDRALTDQMARAISREFGVREEWLRTGEGDVFIQKTRSEQIRSFFDEVEGVQDSFKRRFVTVLSELNEKEWESLENAIQIFSRASTADNRQESEETQREEAIKRKTAAYAQQLREQMQQEDSALGESLA